MLCCAGSENGDILFASLKIALNEFSTQQLLDKILQHKISIIDIQSGDPRPEPKRKGQGKSLAQKRWKRIKFIFTFIRRGKLDPKKA